MNEEPYGSVAITARFATFEEVVDQANRLPYGLAAFAFTENGRRANLIDDAVESGMLGINTTKRPRLRGRSRGSTSLPRHEVHPSGARIGGDR